MDSAYIRPSPPEVACEDHYMLWEEIDVFRNGIWLTGHVSNVLADDKYIVRAGSKNDICKLSIRKWGLIRSGLMVMVASTLRAHQIAHTMPQFKKADEIEVSRNYPYGTAPYHSATVHLPSAANQNGFIYVKYMTLAPKNHPEKKLKEYVSPKQVRPHPPVEPYRFYEERENVEAYHKGAWRTGKVINILGDSRYVVAVAGKKEEETVEVDQGKMRLHRDWVDGSWVPPFPLHQKIEVKNDYEGYHGSWFTATIVGPAEDDMFTIEYEHLKTDDESELLKEKVPATHIRPCPPRITRYDRFRLFERVDIWWNEGWWVGIVTRIYGEIDYTLYFWTTNEEMECDHFCLRPYQEWVDGKFIADFKKPQVQLQRPKPAKANRLNNSIPPEANIYTMGMKVEVKSDEEGYSGTWYPAIMLGDKGSGTFKVEYKTVKDDADMKLLNEIVDYQDMRPGPPVTQSANLFNLRDEVEAWYKLGWWHGYICEVRKGSKYAVHIKGEERVVQIEHSELRPFRNWVNGEWLSTS